MDAVDRADLGARVVLRADAGLGDHIGHGRFLGVAFFGVLRGEA
jgi:hypothetical protein